MDATHHLSPRRREPASVGRFSYQAAFPLTQCGPCAKVPASRTPEAGTIREPILQVQTLWHREGKEMPSSGLQAGGVWGRLSKGPVDLLHWGSGLSSWTSCGRQIIPMV